MKFEEALKVILKKIEVNESDHKGFLNDVETITNEINKAMEANNSIFKDMLKGLKSTALYRKESLIDVPGDVHFFLNFKLPFKVQIVNEGGIVKLKTKEKHPIVEDGFVNGEIFYFLMATNLDLVLSKMKPILCESGRIYELSIGNSSITATEQVEVECKSIFNLHFLPILRFDVGESSESKQQYVAFKSNSSLKICTDEMRQKTVKKTTCFRDVFFLMKTLFIKNSCDNDDIPNYLIQCSIHESINGDDSNLGSLFVQSLEIIVRCCVDKLKIDVLMMMCFGNRNEAFIKVLKNVYRRIYYFYLMDSVELEDLLALFKLS